jgi:hypothetical protein
MKMATLLFFVLTSTVPAGAATMVYSLSGTGSGKKGTTEFVNAPFLITVFADTSSVTPPAGQPGFWTYTVNALEARVDLLGESGAILVPTRMFVSQNFSGGGAGFALQGGFFGGPDLMDFSHSSLSSWDLRSAFGPVSVPTAFIAPGQFTDINTGLGLLTFTSASNVTFTAQPVPEPGTMMLAIAGMAFLSLRTGRRLSRL